MSSNARIFVRPRHIKGGFPDCFKEVVTGTSKTLPNQSYTLRELVARYRCGQRLPVSVGGNLYDSDPNLDEMPFGRTPGTDLVDATIYKNALERRFRIRRERAGGSSETTPSVDKSNSQEDGKLKDASQEAK